MKGYIYIITNLITQKQYIGQTMSTINTRYNHHIHEAKFFKDSMYIHEAMREYGFENFTIDELKCVEANNKRELLDQLNQLEIFYISKYNTLKPNGYNLTNGGSGLREKQRIMVDEYDLYGNYITTHNSLIDASRAVGSNHHSAISKCCNGKSKFAFQRIWRYHGELLGTYNDLRKVRINKYDLDDNFIKSYNSLKEACLDIGKEYNDTVAGNIRRCCKGERKTAYKFKWRYAN